MEKHQFLLKPPIFQIEFTETNTGATLIPIFYPDIQKKNAVVIPHPILIFDVCNFFRKHWRSQKIEMKRAMVWTAENNMKFVMILNKLTITFFADSLSFFGLVKKLSKNLKCFPE